MDIGVYTASLSGHRTAYLQFVLQLFTGQRISIKDLIFFKSPILFLMIEESFFLYFITCLFRSLMGRVTVGFLFRPLPVVESSSIKLKLKKWALYLLKQQKNVKTLLIMPDNVHSKFPDISDGWIYDFQFWDLNESDYQTFHELKWGAKINPLFTAIQKSRGDRAVICALGSQDRIKGFDIFAKTYINNQSIQRKYIFVFGGKVKGYDELTTRFEALGGFSENRFVSDFDLLTLYASSNLVWALYAEDYDQASGIFGRAVQLGIPVLVRDNSLIHKMCKIENIPHVAMRKEETGGLDLVSFDGINEARGRQFRSMFRQRSVDNLQKYLGVNLIEDACD